LLAATPNPGLIVPLHVIVPVAEAVAPVVPMLIVAKLAAATTTTINTRNRR